METPYVQTFGSFIRNGKYPLEADYIFSSIQDLKDWEEQNRKYLHEGLLKLVVLEDKQILFWYYNDTFQPLVESDTLENLAMILEDFELHGKLRDLLRDIKSEYASKFKALQQELDMTQAGVGLNGDGSFDQLSMKNTNYLDGSRSVIEALKALDREMSNYTVDSFIKDAYYDTDTEEIVIVFITKAGLEKVLRVKVTDLIREWEPNNTYPDKVVELLREEVYGGGADKLSADVRLSSQSNNILEKDGNSLLVRGTAENISLGEKNLKEIIFNIQERLDRIDLEWYEG